MRRDFSKLQPDMNLEDVFYQMSASGETICPVFEHDKLIGALDVENINELILVDGAIRSVSRGHFSGRAPAPGKLG